MHKDPYRDFISSFDKSYQVIVLDEELQAKFDIMNQWFQTLTKDEALEKAYAVRDCLALAIARAEEQMNKLGEQLQGNKKKVTANRSYSKF